MNTFTSKFQQVSENLYSVERDDEHHFSKGSKISSEMLEYYKTLVPYNSIEVINIDVYHPE